MALFLLQSPLLPLLFLFGSLMLTASNTALVRLGKFRSKEYLRSTHSPILFFRHLLNHFFHKQEWENLYFCISSSKHIYQLAYATSSFFYLFSRNPSLQKAVETPLVLEDLFPLLLAFCAIILLSILLDFVLRLFATVWSKPVLKITAPITSLYLTLLFPLVGLLLQVTRKLHYKIQSTDEDLLKDKSKLREMIRESELQHHLDSADQKLISSFIHFKQRVAKEIMVPRVDLFSLPSDTTIQEAARLLCKEGYSRIPIYRETLDHILGVILYKDLLKCYTTENQNLDDPVESLAKPVLYAPENKKITQLLQEFRNKQIHMAIVVDEYGGTEGVVTIEDILEELVGEIEDEYDTGEAELFWEIPGGGWIVDAKMTIYDIEEQIGLKIPPSPEYETIGGYVYHCAGTIPSKGWRISHDAFDLEVVSSNERAIKKIKIIPRKTEEEEE